MSVVPRLEWVAVPAGRSAETLRVSVFVAPQVRLVDEPTRDLTLSDVPELVDWPQTLASMSFAVEVGGAAPVAAVVRSTPSSAIWRQIFAPLLRVEPFVVDDPTMATVVGYDSATVVDVLENGYASAAPVAPSAPDPWDPGFWREERVDEQPVEPVEEQPVEPVIVAETPLDASESSLQWFSPFEAAGRRVDQPWNIAPEGVASRALFVAGQANTPVAMADAPDVLEVARFADTVTLTANPPQERPTADDLSRSYDFHRIVAALGEHPALLRHLGLVLDLELPATVLDGIAFTTTAGNPTTQLRLVVERSTSAATIDHAPWVAATTSGATGFAPASELAGPVGFEPIRNAYHIVQFDFESVALQLLDLATGARTDSTAGKLPPLRTAGLRLARRSAAQQVVGQMATMNGLGEDADGDGLLHADEVQRGVRVDVFDERSAHWYPLSARSVRYLHTVGAVVAETVDEATITGNFVGPPLDPGASLAGVSLAVPDLLLTWDGWSLASPRPGKVISADPLDAIDEYRQEHGTSITVRPENEALTAAGLRIDASSVPGTLPRLRFGRTYRMRLRTVDIAGNALPFDAADSAVGELTTSLAVTEPTTFRRFEPVPPPVVAMPDVTRLMSTEERFGDTETRVVVRSRFTTPSPVFGESPETAERVLYPPKCSVQLAEWHGMFDDAIGAHGSGAAAARAAAYLRAGRESGELTPGERTTPWLPDPLSAGVAIHGLPGTDPDETLEIPWPLHDGVPAPIILRVVGETAEPPAAPQVLAGGSVVEIHLAPGQRTTIGVSSLLKDPDVMALPDVWRRHLTASELDKAVGRMRRHTHDQVTPTVPVELVHATAVPVLPPTPSGEPVLEPRVVEGTAVGVSQPWTVHVPSTGRLDLVATWTLPSEDVDLVTDAAGRASWEARAVAATITMASVTVAPPVPGVLVADVTVVDGAGATSATVDLQTTAHPRFELSATAVSRFGEFFPEGTALTVTSEPVPLDVPSTSRPSAPAVLDVLPLSPLHEADGVITREGGWLRVWFAPPWYRSGWGERLAVVAATEQPRLPGTELFELVTLLAPDPARETSPSQDPALTAAMLGDAPPATVTLSETAATGSTTTVQISPRDVAWDERRAAWRADLRIDAPGHYFPFTRLALARHQPSTIDPGGALGTLGVSTVSRVDPIQVLPDRTLRYEFVDNNLTLRFEGHTPSHLYRVRMDGVTEPAPEHLTQSLLVLQRRVPGTSDDLFGWEDVASRPWRAPSPADAESPSELVLTRDPSEPPGEYRLLFVEEDVAHGPALDPYPEGPRSRVIFSAHIALPAAITFA